MPPWDASGSLQVSMVRWLEIDTDIPLEHSSAQLDFTETRHGGGVSLTENRCRTDAKACISGRSELRYTERAEKGQNVGT